MEQISECVNKKVYVKLDGGYIIVGVLKYFNFEYQTLHIKDYNLIGDLNDEKGSFIVLNRGEWKSISYKEE